MHVSKSSVFQYLRSRLDGGDLLETVRRGEAQESSEKASEKVAQKAVPQPPEPNGKVERKTNQTMILQNEHVA